MISLPYIYFIIYSMFDLTVWLVNKQTGELSIITCHCASKTTGSAHSDLRYLYFTLIRKLSCVRIETFPY